MKRRSLILAALAGLASSPAHAEIDTTADAIKMLHRQASCIVYSASKASEIVALPPGSRAERNLLRDLKAGCIGGAYFVEAQKPLLRGAMIEVILRLGDNNRRDGRRLRWAAPFSALDSSEVAALDEQGRTVLAALDFAQCVYVAAPDKVSALLQTAPTYGPEQKAFTTLSPDLGPCLQDGAQITFSLAQLRGFLAEAMYRAIYAAGRRSM
jgi:hypothetical protein